MHFPSDDELMAGPNAFEGVDIDSFDFPEEDGDEASEAAGARDHHPRVPRRFSSGFYLDRWAS